MDHPLEIEPASNPEHASSPLPVSLTAAGNSATSASPQDFGSPRPAGETGRVYWVWAVCGFLLLAVGLVFGQTVNHEFIGFDDNIYVYEVPQITAGLTLDGLWWALTNGPCGEWYPLTTLSSMLDCELYGLHPAGHYLTNVLLHAASSVLLFLVLLRMTDDLWPSAWVAAIFAIHPLHVESVAWVAERRDVLSGLFFMLTLGAYTLYAERPSLARYLAVAGLFAMGLMAKPILVTVPFLLLLLDYWPLNRFGRAAGAIPPAASASWFARLPVAWRLVIEKTPLMALAGMSCAVVLTTHFWLKTEDHYRLSLATRLANALISYVIYLSQSFYPARLASFYPHPDNHLPLAAAAGSFVLLATMTAVAAYCWRRRPYLPVGWLWFLGTLVPVIGLVPVGVQFRADRYTYLSQIGLSIALAWWVWASYRSLQSIGAARWRGPVFAVGSVASVLVLAVVAGIQTSHWRNAETLWTHTIACTEQNPLAHYNLAMFYGRRERFDEAETQLREALAAGLADRQLIALSHYFLAEALTKQGKPGEALSQFELAVGLAPTDARFHAHLAVALASAGQSDRAIAEWREVIRLAPASLPARIELADALLAKGDAAGAIVQCNEVLAREPNVVEAMVILGAALAAQGEFEEATSHLKRALESEPRNARAHFQLALTLYGRGRSPSAIDQLNEATQLEPDNAPLLWQMAWFLATAADPSIRDGARAVELAKKAVQRSDGREPRALDALAAALAESEDFSAAVNAAEQASALALARGDDALAAAIDQRTSLYRRGLPYRPEASPSPGSHTPPQTPR